MCETVGPVRAPSFFSAPLRPRALARVALGLGLCACGALVQGVRADQAAASTATVAAPCPRATYVFLQEHRAAYDAALRRARTWLDGVRVDPIELRRAGIKGRKKFVELLDAYERLWRIADARDRPALMETIRRNVAIAYQDRYHDMLSVDDAIFKEDATSYLRAALLMQRLGLDTTRYRREIARIKPRLDAQMAQRGPSQRMMFHVYYQAFGLEEPFPLAGALEEGWIAKGRDPAQMAWTDVYDFTHEIFAAYDYGERLDADPFDARRKAYIAGALRRLIPEYIAKLNPDLVGELVACARQVRLVDLPVYTEGLDFLLRIQNDDGSWGSLEWARGKYGAHAAQGTILHTTLVAVDALTLAFHEPWNRDRFAGCRG